ncbi:MAG: hypothetical protein A3H57_00755 [Candidatus Taylorbacteria bacterium RIFCSPLOWO2_02_FULL_43_11]|uniref:Uncharacterized protein n=1 Tax=Candidatus Taylorbacteria bacterium RIFCSPHIGHO2_02_FULL_43_32b TaxID=1802306 RepID=A0A1G2MHP3_9BACT|nr:MAG: hypothetical protein A2743_00780 [Candidatus Taylorbacteria bacterium RIFCSPHIGHO2_01_FULL_43_47]OHA23425.1 MAG: hypothetical protein A3C72_00455 [Candidatus Taylorbacteria bacterium RIFCSPHIGHO2_02_FULL_43_32b]OHA36966.1 MAG: hypothetical protein A3H57_00755 [Candidatus Taylorbacteria bacterium RIFCSPLOWO2_02_FULL_43_11]
MIISFILQGNINFDTYRPVVSSVLEDLLAMASQLACPAVSTLYCPGFHALNSHNLDVSRLSAIKKPLG